MSEMVERVAKAMQVAGDKWVDETHSDWRDVDFNVLARAAIQAMREPTGAMSEAGCPLPDDGGAPYCYDREVTDGAYRAMIDRALK